MEKAKNNDITSQYFLANMFASGNGAELNDDKAFYWYDKAAKQGYADAQFSLATIYKNSGQMEQSIIWYKKAAKKNHIESQFCLGNFYLYGFGVEQNTKKALYWFQKAAEQNYSIAEIELGNLYAFNGGIEVKQDYEQAIYWYKKAADKGEAFAQLNLGIIEATQLNYQQSLLWLHKACQNDLTDGCKLYADIIKKM